MVLVDVFAARVGNLRQRLCRQASRQAGGRNLRSIERAPGHSHVVPLAPQHTHACREGRLAAHRLYSLSLVSIPTCAAARGADQSMHACDIQPAESRAEQLPTISSLMHSASRPSPCSTNSQLCSSSALQGPGRGGGATSRMHGDRCRASACWCAGALMHVCACAHLLGLCRRRS